MRFRSFSSAAGIGKSKSTKLERHPNSTPCDNHCSGSHHNIRGKWTSHCCTHSSEIHIHLTLSKCLLSFYDLSLIVLRLCDGFGKLELFIDDNIKSEYVWIIQIFAFLNPLIVLPLRFPSRAPIKYQQII